MESLGSIIVKVWRCVKPDTLFQPEEWTPNIPETSIVAYERSMRYLGQAAPTHVIAFETTGKSHYAGEDMLPWELLDETDTPYVTIVIKFGAMCECFPSD